VYKIDIHTHILPQDLNQIVKSFSDPRYLNIKRISSNSIQLIKNGKLFRKVNCNCWDYNIRISEYENFNVDLQVLSTIPVLFSYWAKDDECLILSEYINNHIAGICKKYPEKFLGLGTIPMQNVDYAIKEMDRIINDLNLHGIQIGSNINGENLSSIKFLPIFEHAEKIGCSIFIHPWEMMGQSKMEKYWLPWLVGMPAETSRAISSIIFGGIFDKYPKLKIAFAHGGGAFPFTVGRMDHGYKMRPDLCAIDSLKTPSSYLKHFYIDSLVHDVDVLHFLLQKIGPNQIALGSDYPFPLGEAHPGKMIEDMQISSSNKQRILAGTALEWLGIDEKKYIGN